jgi:hypothetical protein
MIAEVGHRYPCTGEISLEAVEPKSGDVVELYWDCDRDIYPGEAARVVFDITKIKETHPNSVIHYVGVDTRRITVQYSVAPPGAAGTPALWLEIAIAIGVLIILATASIYLLGRAGFLPWVAKKGNVSVAAVDLTTGGAIAAPFTLDGGIHKTPIIIKGLTPGICHVTWWSVGGYLLPDPSVDTVTVIAGETVEARGEYWPESAGPRPTTGLLVVDTYPVKGTIYVDAEDCGKAPLAITIDKGDHMVSFGDVIGYEAPQAWPVTVHAGGRVPLSVEYKKIGLPTWAKVAIAIGGTALAVGAGIRLLRGGKK